MAQFWADGVTGHVTEAMEGRVSLRVHGAGSNEAQVHALIDTGFSGDLMLRHDTIIHLGLLPISSAEMILGDGTTVFMSVYRGSVTWHGSKRNVNVCASDAGPILGAGLLAGSLLHIEFKSGGHVEISPLP